MQALYQLSYSPRGLSPIGQWTVPVRSPRSPCDRGRPRPASPGRRRWLSRRWDRPAPAPRSQAASASAATVTWPRTLPLTCTGISTVSSTSSAGSASGNGSQASESAWPSARPQLLGDVGGERGQQQHQRLGDLARASPSAYRAVRWLFSSVSWRSTVLKRSSPCRRGPRRSCGAGRGASRRRRRRRRRAGRRSSSSRISAPEPLQEAVHADDRLRLPRPALVERAGEHLVEPQRVGAVGRRTCRRA